MTFILLMVIPSIGNSQGDIDVNEMVGFGCYEDGSQSKSVEKVSRLIDKSKFNSIIKLLDSDNNAERFLAVTVLEKLSDLGKINLTKKLRGKIAEIYNSDRIVSVCSGCIYWDKLTLKAVLEEGNNMRVAADYWLDYKFKPE